MAFSLGGRTTAPSLFGTATVTPSFGGFGATTTTAAAPAFGGFGAATTTAATGFGAFGAAAAPAASTGFGGFGTPASTAASTGFGGFGAAATSTPAIGGFGGFGAPSTTTAATGLGLFGAGTSGLGTTPFGTTTAGTGAFGGGLAGTSGVPGVSSQQLLLLRYKAAISQVQIFGDERDVILTKWNQLQSYWGKGKGYFLSNDMVEFTPDNPGCRFKAIGYSYITSCKNEDGLVALVLKKKQAEVTGVQQQIVDFLHRLFGSKPTRSVCVEGVKPLPDDKTEFVIYVIERQPTGITRRIPASEVFQFLCQANNKQVLTTNLPVENILPKTGFSPDQLKQYLETPPAGIDPLLWQQAKLDNPDPEHFIPVPMIGFKELQQRLKHQEQQTKLHQQRLDMISGDLNTLQQKHSNILSKLEEYKNRHLELGHRLLQVIVKQQIYRKLGFAVNAEEEQLRVQLEALQSELNHPTQFKGRLNELMSQIRMQNQQTTARSDLTYQMDPNLQMEIKQLLKQQQEGIQHLIQIIKDDAQDLKLIDSTSHDLALPRR